MQCGSVQPTQSPTASPTTSSPTLSPTISPTFTGETYPPTSAPTECHEQGLITCGATVSGNVFDGCGNNVHGGSAPDHTYIIRVDGLEVREFCSQYQVNLFRGNRTTPLSSSNEVPATTTESVNGCASGLTSYSFVVTEGLYNVVLQRKLNFMQTSEFCNPFLTCVYGILFSFCTRSI